MNAQELASMLRHLVADTEVKINSDEEGTDRQLLLEDLLGRLAGLAHNLDGRDYPGGAFATPAYPLLPRDEAMRLLEEF